MTSSDLHFGHDMGTLFCLNHARNDRVSSFDKTGGNHDWADFAAGEVRTIAALQGPGIVRHIWCTFWAQKPDGTGNVDHAPRKIVLRAYWDDEETASIEAPLGDFFGMGHGITRNFASAPLQMNPEDGRSMTCYFPMPFHKNARFEVENGCEGHLNFYFYIDYEQVDSLPEDIGTFHAQWRREVDTNGWAKRERGYLEKEKANDPTEPPWWPKLWAKKNITGEGNYVILEATGRGKYVGCALSIDVFEGQANDWYGEGDDMIFIDAEPWPPRLHGTGTEDYFNTAFCPKQPFATATHGLTLYSGEEAGFPWGGKNSMYRFHIQDPIHFEKEIRVTIEHGHANKLSNDYASTAYWYQVEPHAPFPTLPGIDGRLPRANCRVSSDDVEGHP